MNNLRLLLCTIDDTENCRRLDKVNNLRPVTAASRVFYPLPRSFKGLKSRKARKTRVSRGLSPTRSVPAEFDPTRSVSLQRQHFDVRPDINARYCFGGVHHAVQPTGRGIEYVDDGVAHRFGVFARIAEFVGKLEG